MFETINANSHSILTPHSYSLGEHKREMFSATGYLTMLRIVFSLFIVSGCVAPKTRFAKIEDNQRIKNVILLIGDGMGPQQVGFALSYARHAPRSVVPDRRLHLETFLNHSVIGLMETTPADVLVADSASSASQLATGKPALSETIGLDISGNPLRTILETARTQGKSVGLVSDASLTDATPAAFASHVAHRSQENQIALQLIESGTDVLFGGGLERFLPQREKDSKRRDDEDVILRAENAGYKIMLTRNDLDVVDNGKILGLFALENMPDGIAYSRAKVNSDRSYPSLREMGMKAIEILSQKSAGFFLMIEAGLIDKAAHDNDAGTLLHEMLKFDEVIGAVWEWAKNREDTLVLITADHETGSFGLSYHGAHLPIPRILPGTAFVGKAFQPQYNFGSFDQLDRMYDQEESFATLIKSFRKLPTNLQTASELATRVNAKSRFHLNEAQAGKILRTEVNPFYVPGHRKLGAKNVPIVEDFKAFYPNGEKNLCALIGRELAVDQNVVWGTGTHTHTPVILGAYGPERAARRFSGVKSAPEVGRLLFEILGLEPNY